MRRVICKTSGGASLGPPPILLLDVRFQEKKRLSVCLVLGSSEQATWSRRQERTSRCRKRPSQSSQNGPPHRSKGCRGPSPGGCYGEDVRWVPRRWSCTNKPHSTHPCVLAFPRSPTLGSPNPFLLVCLLLWAQTVQPALGASRH